MIVQDELVVKGKIAVLFRYSDVVSSLLGTGDASRSLRGAHGQ